MTRYAKTIVAVVGAVATWASTYFPNDPSVQKWVGLALALATVVSVYATPNQPPAGQPSDPNVSEQGATLIELLVGIFVALLIVVVLVALLHRIG